MFSDEINIHKFEEVGMTVNCSEKLMIHLLIYLTKNNFKYENPSVAINKTAKLSNLLESKIIGHDYQNLRQSVIAFLENAELEYLEETFDSDIEQHSRFNLKRHE